MSIKGYYLDLEKVFELEDFKIEKVFELYYQLVNGAGSIVGTHEAHLNTLLKSGYLVDKKVEDRDKKIEFING
jgi:hypothetical protein